MSKTVSDIIIDTLYQAGARRCYGVVGDTINHFTDAMSRSPLQWVHVRHEEVGGFAAGGEAYVSGRLAVCAGTCGPGSLHFVNGLFETHRNRSPVVLIASQVDSRQTGVGFPQDVDQKKIYEQCSVFCEYLNHPEEARRLTAMAAQAALNKGGVAVLIVHGDTFPTKVEQDQAFKTRQFHPRVLPSHEELEAIIEILNSGKKVSIYAGIGAGAGREEVIALADRLKAPIVHTSRAKDTIEYDNPFNVGMTGVFGLVSGFHAVMECDVLLLLGCDFAWGQFYPDKATIIQIDVDATHIGRRHPIDLGAVGDVASTAGLLASRVEARSDDKWLKTCLKLHEKAVASEYKDARHESPIHPQYLAELIDKHADEDTVFTGDGGSCMVWLLRHIAANGKRRMLTSLRHGTMANAYPQGLGVAKAYPDRQVIALCGDGGMTMLLGDLLTLVQEKIPLKIIVVNNSSLGFVELEQKVEGLLDNYTTLENPDFGAMATAMGIFGKRVEQGADLEAAVEEILAHPGPALLDVITNREELVMPPHIEPSMITGTLLYASKAMLNGRMNDVVNLVKHNYLN
ncbi:Pyruvate dehydrogenase ubiquinone [Halomonadaceae bacterium LMG 33818]|uniref:thiamine pyrophosphate-dependent enzyme n=1 Tax=Cernens ardua TaxID=3402176 RepID=UPI003EDBF760